nr:PREDICTED: tyrosine-protein phosphatase non-receptor type substrate 1-like [Latimeria chalumnae]|eukprot:XP_006014165.2 PREDICTED: tyrosine-protein phosphatase non-receptor type substrate 1-like [Latimeria chalumnae]
MRFSYALGLLLCFSFEIYGDPVLRQPYPSKTSSGKNPEIECLMENEKLDHFVMSWYKQSEGQGPIFLFSHRFGKKPSYGKDVSERFVPETNADANSFSLRIGNFEKGDVGLYYCAVWFSNTYIFGEGTEVIYSDKLSALRRPAVQLLAPAPHEITTRGSATLICIAIGFYPKVIRMSWFVNGTQTAASPEMDALIDNGGRTFSTSGFLTLRAGEWQRGLEVTCQVNHETLQVPLRRSMKHTEVAKARVKGRQELNLDAAFYSYLVLLLSSGLYGIVVTLLIVNRIIQRKMESMPDNAPLQPFVPQTRR